MESSQTVEYVLDQTTGIEGRWQNVVFLTGIMSGFFSALFVMSKIVLTIAPDEYWCSVPEFDSSLRHHKWTIEQIQSVSIPKDEHGAYNKCLMYVRNYTDLIVNNWTESLVPKITGMLEVSQCKRGWDYFDDGQFSNTMAIEWDLVCDSEALSISATEYITGAIVGNLVFGTISDRLGRSRAIFYALVLSLISSCITVVSPSYWFFVVFRFLTSMGYAGLTTTTFVLAMELLPLSRRGVMGMIFSVPFGGGLLITPLLGHYLGNWVYVQMALTALSFAQVCFYWLLPESPRWLIMQGYYDRALDVLRKGAKINKRILPPDEEIIRLMEKISLPLQADLNTELENKVRKTGVGLWQLTWRTRTMIIVSFSFLFTWVVIPMLFIGIEMFESEPDPKDRIRSHYTEEFFVHLLIISLGKYGRRPCYSLALIVGGLFLLVILFVNTDPEPNWMVKVSVIVVDFCATSANALSHLYTTEVFPTEIRTIAVATGLIVREHFREIATPYIVDIHEIKWIQNMLLIIFGTLSLTAGILASALLPETNKKCLSETVFHMEKELFNKSQPRSESMQSLTPREGGGDESNISSRILRLIFNC